MMEAHLDVRRIKKSYGDFLALDDVSFLPRRARSWPCSVRRDAAKLPCLTSSQDFCFPTMAQSLSTAATSSMYPRTSVTWRWLFQNYALFPHMNVEQNVSFGLNMRGTASSESKKRVYEALDLVQLGHLGSRYPKELSGGQQQRVALARALVVRPSVLLLDEPLSNLDALLRKTMREEMRRILKAANITTVIVTHDQEEALVSADSIVLLSAGKVEQRSTPRELYERPSTIFSARFMDVTNFFEGVVVGREGVNAIIDTAFGKLHAEIEECVIGSQVTVAVRPENILKGDDAGENRVTGEVMATSYHGPVRRIEIEANGQR